MVVADKLWSATTHRQLLFHEEVFGHQSSLLKRPRHEQKQVIGINRFRQKIECPFLHCGHRIFDAAVGGHHNHGHIRIDLFRCAEDAEAVSFEQSKI